MSWVTRYSTVSEESEGTMDLFSNWVITGAGR